MMYSASFLSVNSNNLLVVTAQYKQPSHCDHVSLLHKNGNFPNNKLKTDYSLLLLSKRAHWASSEWSPTPQASTYASPSLTQTHLCPEHLLTKDGSRLPLSATHHHPGHHIWKFRKNFPISTSNVEQEFVF